MKKTFIIITSLILICILLIGCNSTNTTIQTSKDLNKNLNLLFNTVNRLDTIDNEYLVNNDIYSIKTLNTTQVPTPNKTYKNVLASNAKILLTNETDNEDLFIYSLETLSSNGYALSDISFDYHKTDTDIIMSEYEIRFSKEGKNVYHLFARIKS